MLQQIDWTEWFSSHPNIKDGNRNMSAFSSILKAGFSEEEKLWSLVEEIDTVILAADANNKIMIFRSPKNFGGTRSRPDNKVVCMLGLGTHVTYVLIDLRTALADCQIVVPAVTDLSHCKSAQDVAQTFQLQKKMALSVSKACQFSSQHLFSAIQFLHQEQMSLSNWSP